ncbi:MAG TPA: peptidoglycan-binding domain-containing protein [Candidatus Omnitrophota bacterium]|nr:hypothetical protein [Candidatus Omnitrophota bacterium]HRK61801.1 peptidoglycan-binding domain-containing protein [Candidatus Omnitrophota bacterium]
MKKLFSFSFLSIAAALLLLSGCASTGSRANSQNAVNAQMGVLADEVTRLDMALQETRAQLQREQSRVAELEGRLGGAAPAYAPAANTSYAAVSSEPYSGVYRTPSGFEIPAASIQKALKGSGHYQGEVDGKIGPDTREAVRNFQRDNGLTPDGIVGKTTWNRLKTHLGSYEG